MNRLKIQTKFMEEDMETIKSLQKQLEEGEGYLLGITILGKDGKLHHSFLTNKFPKQEILRAHSKVEGLLVSLLKGEE